MSQLSEEEGVSPSKGWVRDGVLSFLARRPGTVTEIANALGVSKATVSYHTKALIRKDMIEIADIKSIRGGVYSKTYALKRGAIPLVGRRTSREGSLTKVDEWYERLLMNLRLEPAKKAREEIEIFLYHLFRLLEESDSTEDSVFEDYGRRAGEVLVPSSLKFTTLRSGLKGLCAYLAADGIAHVSAETRKGEEARLVCTECFDNKEYGNLVCSFTKGVLTGAIRSKHGGMVRLERTTRSGRSQGCVYTVKTRGFKP